MYSVRQQNWPVLKCISKPPWKKNVNKNCALLLRILLRSFCRKPDRAGVIVYTVVYNCTQAWFSKFPGRGQFEVTVFTVTQMWAKQWTKEEKRVVVMLWRVETSLATIRSRLQMPERTLRRLIAADRRSAADGLPDEIPDGWLNNWGRCWRACPGGLRRSLRREVTWPSTRREIYLVILWKKIIKNDYLYVFKCVFTSERPVLLSYTLETDRDRVTSWWAPAWSWPRWWWT